jgi:hypothetical protein
MNKPAAESKLAETFELRLQNVLQVCSVQALQFFTTLLDLYPDRCFEKPEIACIDMAYLTVNQVPAEASFVGLPTAIDELEALVRAHRAKGDYTEAGRLQKKVEVQKAAEERARLYVGVTSSSVA